MQQLWDFKLASTQQINLNITDPTDFTFNSQKNEDDPGNQNWNKILDELETKDSLKLS